MKKGLLITISILAAATSVVMYIVGKNSSHLSELYDMFWVPLPLAALALGAGMMKK